ncbi:MAG: hypothetical protein P0Y60_13865 [Candidatus Microbacterium colombiense]|nr:MAG: hypothetical protein P0Y60_13865 [Microbacterium sp.]
MSERSCASSMMIVSYARQEPVAVDLVQQDAVGHQRDAGRLRDLVGEAHLVADERAELDLQLLRDALGDRARGESARLRVGDAFAAELEGDLGQLRGLPRPGRARRRSRPGGRGWRRRSRPGLR